MNNANSLAHIAYPPCHIDNDSSVFFSLSLEFFFFLHLLPIDNKIGS